MDRENIELLENEVRKSGLKNVSNMLQRPTQLDKIDQIKKRIKRNINSKESMLKTAMQTMIDDAKTSLIHLKTVEQDLNQLRDNIVKIEDKLPEIALLSENLKHVLDESNRHSQYEVSMDNLKHIFNVPETIAKTEELIDENRLLEAHKSLFELDASRDNLLYQLHRLAPNNHADKNMLKHYFADVDRLSEKLGKQLWLLVRLTLNTVRKEPSIIVDALRIIEREENIDRMVKKRADNTGFHAIGRPKNWRKRVFEILEEAVAERIAGNKFQERDDSEMWLMFHLGMIRKIFVEDMRVVKYACASCFPPDYDIVRQMFHIYHRNLSSYLQEMAPSLEGNEFVTLLHWFHQYEGPEMCGHPELRFSLEDEQLEPLLPSSVVEDIHNRYLATIEKNYKEWLANTIRHELKDWQANTTPDVDESGHYQTSAPLIVFQMIDQHLQVANTVSESMLNRVLLMSMKHLTDFANQYKDSVNRYAKTHFENRTQSFTTNIIAISNNCTILMDNALKFQKKYRRDDINQLKTDKAFSDAVKSFEKLKEESIIFLIKEVHLDVDREIEKVGNQEWLDGVSSSVIENVCLTLEDYFHDYRFLKDNNSDSLKMQLQRSLAKSYIYAIMIKKMTLRSQQQRDQFADRCIREARILDSVIKKLPTRNPAHFVDNNPFEVIPMLMEFIKLKDLSMLYLEISGLLKRYPDVKVDHFAALLSLREDIKMNVRKKVEESMPDEDCNPQHVRTIFSELSLN